MKIMINGKSTEIPDGSSVVELMKIRKLQGKNFVFVLNGEVLAPEKTLTAGLKPGDSIEIVQIVQGG